MSLLSKTRDEVAKARDLFAMADLSYCDEAFRTEVKGRVDGFDLALEILDKTIAVNEARFVRPLGQLNGAQIPNVVHYKIDEIIETLNYLLGKEG